MWSLYPFCHINAGYFSYLITFYNPFLVFCVFSCSISAMSTLTSDNVFGLTYLKIFKASVCSPICSNSVGCFGTSCPSLLLLFVWLIKSYFLSISKLSLLFILLVFGTWLFLFFSSFPCVKTKNFFFPLDLVHLKVIPYCSVQYFKCNWCWNCHTTFLLSETDIREELYKVFFQVPFFHYFHI